MSTDSPPDLIVALDGLDASEVRTLAQQLPSEHCRLKVGSELFVKAGPALVQELQAQGFKIFLDLKFHDIPNTVAAAMRAVKDLGVWMCTVHASGGPAMLTAAHDAAQPEVQIVAVTVLTSLDDADLDTIGYTSPVPHQALRLAQLAHQCGLSGIVCSPHEAAEIREQFGADFRIVTPGIRLTSKDDDQKRIATPAMAIHAGSNHLVIGRPIASAPDPVSALNEFLKARDDAMQAS